MKEKSYKTQKISNKNTKTMTLPWATTLNVSGSKLPSQNVQIGKKNLKR